MFFYWVNLPRLGLNKDIKKRLFPEILKFFGDFKYIPESNDLDHVKECKKFGIVPEYDVCTTVDIILGSYKDGHVRLEEWDMEGEEISFEGVAILLNFNRNFSGQTVVFLSEGKPEKCSNHLEKIKLEDPELEAMYDVYSTDQIESRDLVTPSLMEKVKKLSELFRSNEFKISFYENQLFLMFSSGDDVLEPDVSISERINLIPESKKVIGQMNLIFDLIDHLNQENGL